MAKKSVRACPKATVSPEWIAKWARNMEFIATLPRRGRLDGEIKLMLKEIGVEVKS